MRQFDYKAISKNTSIKSTRACVVPSHGPLNIFTRDEGFPMNQAINTIRNQLVTKNESGTRKYILLEG